MCNTYHVQGSTKLDSAKLGLISILTFLIQIITVLNSETQYTLAIHDPVNMIYHLQTLRRFLIYYCGKKIGPYGPELICHFGT